MDKLTNNIKNFNEFDVESDIKNENNVNEALLSNFNYQILAEFVKVRNSNIAGYSGPDPSPRLEFIMNLLDSLGLEYELDVWPNSPRPVSNSLEDVFGFGVDEIDEILESTPKEWTEEEYNAEKDLLINAFDWFELTVEELNVMLRQAEQYNEDSRKKRMLNTLIRIKKQENIVTAPNQENNFFNLYLKGSSNKMIMAHHDVANVRIDNCNDNSASVINAIATKLMLPDVNVAITDGEENGGHGAARTAEKINEGYFGNIEFVLNFELTAVGGTDFFIEDFPSSALQQRVTRLFPGVDTHHTPFHDGMILRRNGIDSVVINPLPRKENGALDYSLLYYCHSAKDTIELANYDDMKDFVEKVVMPILTNTTPPHIKETAEEITDANIEKTVE